MFLYQSRLFKLFECHLYFQEIRTIVKEIDQSVKEALISLQVIHSSLEGSEYIFIFLAIYNFVSCLSFLYKFNFINYPCSFLLTIIYFSTRSL